MPDSAVIKQLRGLVIEIEIEMPVGGLSVRRVFLKYFSPTQLRSFSSSSQQH